MMMVSKSMKVLNIIAGVLLMVLGVYCLCNQDIAAMTAGLMIGVLMLLSGVMEIVVFATTSGFMLGSGWLLLDGVVDRHPFLVSAAEPVVHHDVAAVSVYAVAFVFRRFAVRQRV